MREKICISPVGLFLVILIGACISLGTYIGYMSHFNRADINHDHKVDMLDFSILSTNYGEER